MLDFNLDLVKILEEFILKLLALFKLKYLYSITCPDIVSCLGYILLQSSTLSSHHTLICFNHTLQMYYSCILSIDLSSFKHHYTFVNLTDIIVYLVH